jgi:hypothetical protein
MAWARTDVVLVRTFQAASLLRALAEILLPAGSDLCRAHYTTQKVFPQ